MTLILALALLGRPDDVHRIAIPSPQPGDFFGRNVDQARWGMPAITGGDFEVIHSTPPQYGGYQGMEVEVRIIGGGRRRLDFPLMVHRDGLWERAWVKSVEVGP